MSSPEVWADAKPRFLAWAAANAIPLALPNDVFRDVPNPFSDEGTPQSWVAVEILGDVAGALELGAGGFWDEEGFILVHVMVPALSGIDQGLALRKSAVGLFRFALGGPVNYRSVVLDPGGSDESGNWHRLTARIGYSFTDKPSGA